MAPIPPTEACLPVSRVDNRHIAGNVETGRTCTRPLDVPLGHGSAAQYAQGRPTVEGRAAVSEDDADQVDTTYMLLTRAKAGSRDALDRLFARHIPLLRRWASGRLPRWARDMADTSDLVQETVIQTFKRVEAFEPRGEGSLQAYLRQAVLNRIRSEIRSKGRKPAIDALDEQIAADHTSPLEAAIRQEQLDRYDAAMARLTDLERELIVARLELGLTYEEIAGALKKPSWNAARMATARALVRLAEQLKRD